MENNQNWETKWLGDVFAIREATTLENQFKIVLGQKGDETKLKLPDETEIYNQPMSSNWWFLVKTAPINALHMIKKACELNMKNSNDIEPNVLAEEMISYLIPYRDSLREKYSDRITAENLLDMTVKLMDKKVSNKLDELIETLMANTLIEDTDYSLDELKKTISGKHSGLEKLKKLINIIKRLNDSYWLWLDILYPKPVCVTNEGEMKEITFTKTVENGITVNIEPTMHEYKQQLEIIKSILNAYERFMVAYTYGYISNQNAHFYMVLLHARSLNYGTSNNQTTDFKQLHERLKGRAIEDEKKNNMIGVAHDIQSIRQKLEGESNPREGINQFNKGGGQSDNNEQSQNQINIAKFYRLIKSLVQTHKNNTDYSVTQEDIKKSITSLTEKLITQQWYPVWIANSKPYQTWSYEASGKETGKNNKQKLLIGQSTQSTKYALQEISLNEYGCNIGVKQHNSDYISQEAARLMIDVGHNTHYITDHYNTIIPINN